MKRYDTSQSSWIDVNTIKRYDSAQQSWIDVGSIKRYDSTEQAWVEVEGGYIMLQVGSKQLYDINSIKTIEQGNGITIDFGFNTLSNITFVADGLDLPAGTTISLNYYCSNTSYAYAMVDVYLSNYNSGSTPYTSVPTQNSGYTNSLDVDTPTNYGSISKIEIKLVRSSVTMDSGENAVVTIGHISAGTELFKFPTVSL